MLYSYNAKEINSRIEKYNEFSYNDKTKCSAQLYQPNIKSSPKRVFSSTLIGFFLGACRSGNETYNSTPIDTIKNQPTPLSLDLYNPSGKIFTPYNFVNGTQVVEVSPGRFMHFITVMLDVDKNVDIDFPNKSNLILLEINEGKLSLYDHVVINGNGGIMHFGDFNNSGTKSLVQFLAGEDGRIIVDDDQMEMQNIIYDIEDKSVTYFGFSSWSHGGAVIDLNGDGSLEIIDAYFGGDGSTIYNGTTLEPIVRGSIFEAGPGMNAFTFGDVTNDGMLNFYQRIEDRYSDDGEKLIVGTIYNIKPDFEFEIAQEVVLGSFSGPSVKFVSWNGNPDSPDIRVLGDFLGIQFGEYQSWYTAIADINGDGSADIVELLSFSTLVDTGKGYFVEGSTEWKLMIIFNDNGDFSTENVKIIDIPHSAYHGSMLFDFNLDGHLDLFLNISNSDSGAGYPINDRIYLNDGSGNFIKLSDDIDFAFDANFTRNGSYSPVRIGDETYLSGISSDVFGQDLSAMLIPISDVL